VSPADLALPPPREGSRQVAARIAAARDIQARRCRGRRPAPGRNRHPRSRGPQAARHGGRALQALGRGLSPGDARASPAPSPISRPAPGCAGCMSPRRSATAGSPRPGA